MDTGEITRIVVAAACSVGLVVGFLGACELADHCKARLSRARAARWRITTAGATAAEVQPIPLELTPLLLADAILSTANRSTDILSIKREGAPRDSQQATHFAVLSEHIFMYLRVAELFIARRWGISSGLAEFQRRLLLDDRAFHESVPLLGTVFLYGIKSALGNLAPEGRAQALADMYSRFEVALHEYAGCGLETQGASYDPAYLPHRFAVIVSEAVRGAKNVQLMFAVVCASGRALEETNFFGRLEYALAGVAAAAAPRAAEHATDRWDTIKSGLVDDLTRSAAADLLRSLVQDGLAVGPASE